MSEFSFYKAFTLFSEAGPTPPPPGGGADAGGMPPMGGPPGDLGGMGGGMGGPPGGGDPAAAGGQPIEIKTLPAGDVWKLLEKILKDKKFDKFFEEINIKKRETPTIHSKHQQAKKSSLQK
jgi:hypothetical protein